MTAAAKTRPADRYTGPTVRLESLLALLDLWASLSVGEQETFVDILARETFVDLPKRRKNLDGIAGFLDGVVNAASEGTLDDRVADEAEGLLATIRPFLSEEAAS